MTKRAAFTYIRVSELFFADLLEYLIELNDAQFDGLISMMIRGVPEVIRRQRSSYRRGNKILITLKIYELELKALYDLNPFDEHFKTAMQEGLDTIHAFKVVESIPESGPGDVS